LLAPAKCITEHFWFLTLSADSCGHHCSFI